jgi:hypothetical protein
MHKKTILCLSLISMFLLATTTSISKPVFAIDESSFQDQDLINILELTDEQIICEECLKNWLDSLNNPQRGTLLNALINTINVINFGDIPCTSNTLPLTVAATCIMILPFDDEYDTAQLSEICNNLRLALNFLVFVQEHPVQKEALAIIENAVKVQTDQDIDITVQGLFDCLERVLLPITFTCEHCFAKFLTDDELTNFLGYLSILEPHATNNLKEYCQLLANLQDDGLTTSEIKSLIITDFPETGFSDKLYNIIDCLETIRFL